MAFFEDLNLILYNFILAICSGAISIMVIIGFIFKETAPNFWTILIWFICLFSGLLLGQYLFY